MADPFVGEIKIWGLNFAPRGWSFCSGQLLPISQNTALFSLIGTTFGGDGRTTFALPDLRGRVPVHPDASQGQRQGERVGVETVALTQAELASHTHTLYASSVEAESPNPGTQDTSVWANASENVYNTPSSLVGMNPQAVSADGGGQSHDNMQPSLVLNFCIAMVGIYPSRN